MNSKFSFAKSIVIAAALVTGASGIARADDSSMNPFTGDSYAYFNGGNLGDINPPSFDQAPSLWRQSHPNGPSFNQLAALSTFGIVFKPSPVLDNAPSPWRQNHPSGLTYLQFAAMGSEAIAARLAVPASTNAVADTASGSREAIATRITKFFHATPADQATPAN